MGKRKHKTGACDSVDYSTSLTELLGNQTASVEVLSNDGRRIRRTVVPIQILPVDGLDDDPNPEPVFPERFEDDFLNHDGEEVALPKGPRKRNVASVSVFSSSSRSHSLTGG